MNKLSRIVAAILLAGIAVATTGCYAVHGYHEVGLALSHGDGYGHGHAHRHHQHHSHHHHSHAW